MKQKIYGFFFVLLLTIQIAYADGGGWWYSYETDSFSPLTQSSQLCSIDYKNGMEDMLISVRTKLQGERIVWIFPIPSKPENTEIDVVKEFPEYAGFEVKSKAVYTIHEANLPMLMSQVYLPLVFIWNFGIFGGGGGTTYGVGEDSGVTVHEHVEKRGLTTELVTAEDEERFNKYLRDKGLDLPEESLSTLREYIGEEYSFVVSWISDVEEYRREIEEEAMAVKIKFPTNRIFYPLRLTSIYGEEKIPMIIYVNGYASPRLFKDIRNGSRVRYYANDQGLRYTKVNIKTRSDSFTEDLWFNNAPPVDILVADFIATKPIPSMIILFAIYSCLASLIAGLIIFKGEIPVHKLTLIGLSNFLTIIGFAITTLLLTKTKGEDRELVKKLLMYLTATLLSIFLIIVFNIVLTIFIPLLGVVSGLIALAFAVPLIFLTIIAVPLIFLTIIAVPIIFLTIVSFGLRKLRKKMEYIMLFSILFLVITISANWFLVAAFQLELQSVVHRCTGFTKIKCFDRSIQWSSEEGVLTATFMNGAMTDITITDIHAEGFCSFTDESGKGTTLFGGGDNTTITLSRGEEIQFTCDSGLMEYEEAGRYLGTDITITYTEEVAGRNITHTDGGRID